MGIFFLLMHMILKLMGYFKMKRHTCIICKRKRYEMYMKNVFYNSWACKDKYFFQYCCDNKEIHEAKIIIDKLKTFKYISLSHLSRK